MFLPILGHGADPWLKGTQTSEDHCPNIKRTDDDRRPFRKSKIRVIQPEVVATVCVKSPTQFGDLTPFIDFP